MPANMQRRLFLGLLPALLLANTGICSPPNPNFSETWKQSNERCTPKRTGDVTLQIDHRDPDLIVETTVLQRVRERSEGGEQQTLTYIR
jgi:hypothetical protein